jgi:hypothetical protein
VSASPTPAGHRLLGLRILATATLGVPGGFSGGNSGFGAGGSSLSRKPASAERAATAGSDRLRSCRAAAWRWRRGRRRSGRRACSAARSGPALYLAIQVDDPQCDFVAVRMVERQLAKFGLLLGQHIKQRPLWPFEIFHLSTKVHCLLTGDIESF